MIGDHIYNIAHALDSRAVECLERRAEKLGTHPDVLILRAAREVIDRWLIEEAQEKHFTGEGR
jgi:hypothetical protein